MSIKSIKPLTVAFLSLMFMSISMASCGGDNNQEKQKLSPEQIDSKYSSGVVLIKNCYYYSISFNGCNNIYFTGIENGEPQNLTVDLNEISPVTSFGTGFFIGKDGTIATNSHVATPDVDIASVRAILLDAFQSLANDYTKEINEINEKLSKLQLAILAADTNSEKRQYQQLYNELSNEREEKQESVNMFNAMNGKDYNVTLHSEIGIAYNDTHVTNLSDFNDCVVVADDPDHDLAIIQLKDKTTPEKKHVFRLPSSKKSDSDDSDTKNKDKGVRVGKKLYMIGYNLGPSLALTNDGIKAQITSGEISQDTDESRIMYTIAALHGSSGSPVVDEYGKLIAINYAGLDKTQNFNFGIKSSHLKKLANKLKED